jgi:hypothetical protein
MPELRDYLEWSCGRLGNFSHLINEGGRKVAQEFRAREPLTVQKELMRHASIQTTLNTYGGGMMDSMREAHGRVVKQAMPR